MEKIEKMFEKLEMKMQNIDEKLEHIIQEVGSTKEENKKLKVQIENQENRIQFLERELRKNNLIIQGIQDDEEENVEQIEEKVGLVIKNIGANIYKEIEEVRRLGKYQINKTRPILIKLTKNKIKNEILKNTKYLKGSDIWIDSDYPRNIQEERKQLIPHLKEAKMKGQKVQLKYNKLIIENKVYGVENLKQLEQEKIEETNKNKRKNNVRSPQSATLEEQINKITRTTRQQKNSTSSQK